MVEYAMMLVLVVIACALTVSLLGDQVLALWTSIDRSIRVTLDIRCRRTVRTNLP